MLKFQVLVACVVLVALLGPPAAHAQRPSVPRFEAGSCPFKVDSTLTEGKDLSCGWLIVPENRLAANDKTIKLAVAILKSSSAHPAPDPVIFLNGGPGGSTLSNIGRDITAANREDWAGDRDLILIDQRGTGYSQPALPCPELDKQATKTLAKRMTFQKEDTLESQAVAACRARLVAQGIDLSAYTSVQNAADIADLRTAFGYSQVNLYGISYGTRLALSVMRYFPQGIRSVVLDSVYGPAINTFTDIPRSAAHIFNLVISGCARASGCKRRYPHLRRDLYSAVKRLDKKPPNVLVSSFSGDLFTVTVTGEVFLQSLFSALYDHSFLYQIPQVIHGTAQGSNIELELIARYDLPGRGGPSMGMYYSVECSEDLPGTSQADIDAASLALPVQLRRDVVASSTRLFHDCQQWNVPAVPAAQKQAVVSDIPTMVMEGEYDPITPPPYGATVAQTLSHSFMFVYPGLTHGTRFQTSCPSDMMWHFLDDPTQRPNASCIAGMPEPFAPSIDAQDLESVMLARETLRGLTKG